MCGEDEAEEVLLLCDGCDDCFHTYCVGLSAVPDGDFYCWRCAERQSRHSTGVLSPTALIGSLPSPLLVGSSQP